jgi:hypothetical protein
MKNTGQSRNGLINSVVAVAAIAVVLLAIELVFRGLDIRGYHEARTRDWDHAVVPTEDRLPGVGIQFVPNSHFELNYDSNPRGYFDENNGLTYRINEHGFRGPSYPLSKPDGTHRVVLLGDSFTFGEGVRFDHTFGERLERLLDRGSKAVEVLNLGVSGARTSTEVSYLRQRGLALEPDLVLLVYVLNDAAAGGLDLWEDFRHQYEKRWLRGSYLASYLYARVGRSVMGKRYIDELIEAANAKTEKWRWSMRLLLEARRLSVETGSKFAVIIFPFMYQLDDGYPFREFHQRIFDYCRSHQIEVLDLLGSFSGREDRDLWVHPSDQHPNEIAHEIAAEGIGEFVVQRGLL